ncbi:hypothetical protein QQM79_00770 [Marinobacteraceae bacterium S3BR75-40.1]
MIQDLQLVDRLFTGWRETLGGDYEGYRNHVYRVVNLTHRFHPEMSEEEFTLLQVAAAYHDVGIWLDNTLDYLEPSADRAGGFLVRHIDLGKSSLAEKQRLVRAMIYQHHAIRPARDPDLPLVDAFRKADWTDVLMGAYAFGLPRKEVKAIQQAFPDAGFHMRLLQLAGHRLKTNPFKPLPMLRW